MTSKKLARRRKFKLKLLSVRSKRAWRRFEFKSRIWKKDVLTLNKLPRRRRKELINIHSFTKTSVTPNLNSTIHLLLQKQTMQNKLIACKPNWINPTQLTLKQLVKWAPFKRDSIWLKRCLKSALTTKLVSKRRSSPSISKFSNSSKRMKTFKTLTNNNQRPFRRLRNLLRRQPSN